MFDKLKRDTSIPVKKSSSYTLIVGIPNSLNLSETMSRSTIMTTGFLLFLIGIQLNLVQAYTLTPRATKFWAESLADPVDLTDLQTDQKENSNSFFSSASFNNGANSADSQQVEDGKHIFLHAKQIQPPDWICWPIMFVGAAVCLHGVLLKQG